MIEPATAGLQYNALPIELTQQTTQIVKYEFIIFIFLQFDI